MESFLNSQLDFYRTLLTSFEGLNLLFSRMKQPYPRMGVYPRMGAYHIMPLWYKGTMSFRTLTASVFGAGLLPD
jgi:hypothetical protein